MAKKPKHDKKSISKHKRTVTQEWEPRMYLETTAEDIAEASKKYPSGSPQLRREIMKKANERWKQSCRNQKKIEKKFTPFLNRLVALPLEIAAKRLLAAIIKEARHYAEDQYQDICLALVGGYLHRVELSSNKRPPAYECLCTETKKVLKERILPKGLGMRLRICVG